jgi:hypothetical protein
MIYPFQVLPDHKQQSPSLKKIIFLATKKKFPMQPETLIIVFTTARYLPHVLSQIKPVQNANPIVQDTL